MKIMTYLAAKAAARRAIHCPHHAAQSCDCGKRRDALVKEIEALVRGAAARAFTRSKVRFGDWWSEDGTREDLDGWFEDRIKEVDG